MNIIFFFDSTKKQPTWQSQTKTALTQPSMQPVRHWGLPGFQAAYDILKVRFAAQGGGRPADV